MRIGKIIGDLLTKNPLTKWGIWAIRMIQLAPKQVRLRYMAVGTGTTFGRFTRLDEYAYLIDSSIGNHSYVAARAKLERVDIGRYTCIGPDVRCGLGEHPSDSIVSSHPLFFAPRYGWVKESKFDEFKRTTIGNDVWIGAGVIIIDGVTIGDGAIVAAGSVVVKDVAPYCIMGGIPAREIKKRFSSEEIDFLLAYKWWDKDEEELKRNVDHFEDIQKLIRLEGDKMKVKAKEID